MDHKILIIGNTCSGKTEFAKALSKSLSISYYSLDGIFWKGNQRFKEERKYYEKNKRIELITKQNSWIIEGKYSQMIETVSRYTKSLIWLDIEEGDCLENLDKRGDCNKYELTDRIKQYYLNDKGSCRKSHEEIWGKYTGHKMRLSSLYEIDAVGKGGIKDGNDDDAWI
jgi:adenylate kinase family enzyme